MTAEWLMAIVVAGFFAGMAGSMFAAWVIGRAIGMADERRRETRDALRGER